MLQTKEIIAKITIHPLGGKRANFKFDMPIWSRVDDTGKLLIMLGVLGGIVVPIDKDDDVDKRISEALWSFIDASEKFGDGFQNELKALGWQIKRNTTARLKNIRGKEFAIPNDPMYAGMAKTGDYKSLSVEV